MRVRNEILSRVKADADLKRELMYRLGFSEATLYRYLSQNAADGALTKVKAVKIIALKLGLGEDMILTP